MAVITNTGAMNTTQLPAQGAPNGLSDPFTVGIQIVQTIALGIILVLACITLFHCREKSKAENAARAKAIDDKLAQLSERISDLKATIQDLSDGLEEGANGRVKTSSVYEVLCRDEKRESGFGAWEREILKRLRGI